jgi:hypothetical protein
MDILTAIIWKYLIFQNFVWHDRTLGIQ